MSTLTDAEFLALDVVQKMIADGLLTWQSRATHTVLRIEAARAGRMLWCLTDSNNTWRTSAPEHLVASEVERAMTDRLEAAGYWHEHSPAAGKHLWRFPVPSEPGGEADWDLIADDADRRAALAEAFHQMQEGT